MSFDTFIETSLDHVPPEFERNFTLIRQLDERTKDSMDKVHQLLTRYRDVKSASQRTKMKKEMMATMEKINGFADDKVELALQTYELVEKNIKQLVSLPNSSVLTSNEGDETAPAPLLGYDMPPDPNEPRYCYCHEISHGEMIACDNVDCQIEWFHYACVGLKEAPKGKWFCNVCSKTNVDSGKKRKKKRTIRRAYY